MKRRVLVFLLLITVLACFIACNGELSTDTGSVNVHFAPTVAKALNQDGKASQVSTAVSDYRWEYYCSKESPATKDASELAWTRFFDGNDVGLGQIKNLEKNNSYYFGLRGYSTDTNELVWEGFHYETEGDQKTPGTVKLSSRTVLVTIDVYTKGSGNLYFNISAPLVLNFGIKEATTLTDKFVVSYRKLNESNTTYSDYELQSTYVEEDNEFVYSDAADTPKMVMQTGDYLFTICQKTWDSDTKQYVDVPGRKQVLIVTIQSGVDSVIYGALDSSSGIMTMDYEAGGYSDSSKKGIKVEFNASDTSSVTTFKASVYNSSKELIKTANKGFHLIEGYEDGELFTIKWTSVSDMSLYVNGDEIKKDGDSFVTTGTDGYLERTDGKKTKLKTSGTNSIIAEVCEADTYIVTIRYKEGDVNQTVSFTVCRVNAPVVISGTSTFKLAVRGLQKTWDGILYYDNGNGWTEWNGKQISSGSSKKIRLRGRNNTVITGVNLKEFSSWDLDHGVTPSKDGIWQIEECTGTLKVTGDITSLLDYTKEPTKVQMGDYAFTAMFYNWSELTEGPTLPSLVLGKDAYRCMFARCINLNYTPELPATTLADGCYQYMFGCSGLSKAMDLPALTVKGKSYYGMFDTCKITEMPQIMANIVETQGFREMFDDCMFLITPSDLHVTEMTGKQNMYSMFSGCAKMERVPSISGIETLTPDCFGCMFQTCKALKEVPSDYLPWTTVFADSFRYMFAGCKNLTQAPALPATTLAIGCYKNMFSECVSLTTAPALSTMSLAANCYSQMFSGCASLTQAPALPAKVLADNCYSQMFSGCTNLTQAPALPATTLAYECYCDMFNNCTKLTQTPEFPATTVASRSCYQMFYGCSSLTTASDLPATTLASECYGNMFYNCTSLTHAPALFATTLDSKCYYQMFNGCTALTIAPALYATDFAIDSCRNMFINCSNLKELTIISGRDSYITINSIAAKSGNNDRNVFYYMFSGCKLTASLGAGEPASAYQQVITVTSDNQDCMKGMFENWTTSMETGTYYVTEKGAPN